MSDTVINRELTGEDWKEVFLDGSPEAEDQAFKKYTDDIRLVQERNQQKSEPHTIRRAFHAKVHAGITNAEFRIDPDIPQHLQHGIFQPGKSYPADVRLSNASGLVQPDIKNDLRGLAVRIFSTDEHGEKRINDLLMTSAPVSHARNAYQFMAFAKAASSSPTWLMPLRLVFAVGIGETIRMLSNLIRYSARRVTSLATETYWSRGPFQLGEAALHFHFKPSDKTPAAPAIKSAELSDNYLRDELINRLENGLIAFDFMVQLFVNEKKTPIEDGATLWKESDSPPIRIAQLILPQQDLGQSDAYDSEAIVQQTGFSPWNGAKIFRPLGQLNRARKPVYAASEDFRLKRKVDVPPPSIFIRLIEGIFAFVNRLIRWDKLPPWLGVLSLMQIRSAERQKNLYDTETNASQASALPRGCPLRYLTNRSPDGSYNDLSDPDMGRAGKRFGRNLPLDQVLQPSDERILTPNPRTVARELMTRESFQPATTLNLLAAAWIQFMIHDWVTHSTTGDQPLFEIEIDENDDWPNWFTMASLKMWISR